MPRGCQQPALVHGTIDWCLSGRRYAGVGDGSAGGLAASGQRIGGHQELDGGERVSCLSHCCAWFGLALKQNSMLILGTLTKNFKLFF